MRAICVDKDYGSVSAAELNQVQKAYAKVDIELVLQNYNTEDEIIEGCKGADVILATGNPPITRKVMTALPELKFIQRFGAGVNSIDLDAASDLGKVVLNLPGFCAKELADLATAMIMGLIRNTVYYDREIRKGNWPKCQYLLPGDVRTMTLGLFGFGAAGRSLYETLLTRSDIISIHVALTPETKYVFNRDAFRKMKSTAMIINTARGPIINQKDLAWALEKKEIQYAGLDTMEQEPIGTDDPLLKMDNVILSPHSGSYGVGAKKKQLEMVCTLVPDAVAKGTIPAHCVANRAIMQKEDRFMFQ